MSRPARLTIRFPKDVAQDDDTGAPPTTRIIWLPDSPTRAFPVLPVSSNQAA